MIYFLQGRKFLLFAAVFSLLQNSIILSQTPKVISFSPSFNEIVNTIHPDISVQFNVPMDSSSFNALSFTILGKRSGYHEGNFSFSDSVKSVSFTSYAQYNAGERVIVTLSTKLKSQQEDTLNGFTWEFRIPTKRTYINFARPVSYGGGGLGMQCIDMNNDGYPDIVTSSGVIWINDGKGNFTEHWQLNDADGFCPIVVDDFNRDGFMDVLYRGSDGMKIGYGDGKGNFRIVTKPFWFGYYISADFNNDGYPDIAGTIGSEGDTSKSYLKWGIAFNDGKGNFDDTVEYKVSGGGNPAAMAPIDVDNDGNIDIVIESFPGPGFPGGYGFNGIIVCRNNGKGIFNKFESYKTGSTNTWLDNIYPADFNNDGFTDIAIMGYYGIVMLNHGDGTFTSYLHDTTIIPDTTDIRRFWGAENLAQMTGGDINGDGWIDLIVSGYGWPPPPEKPTVYYTVLANDDSYFNGSVYNSAYHDSLPHGIFSVAAADLNNNGYLDIVHSGIGVYVTLHRDTVTAVKDSYAKVSDINLYQNYPNPFNGQTEIKFELSKPDKIKIVVYDILGKKVKVLENTFMNKGKHSINWDGKDNDGNELPSGIYFIKMNSSNYSKTIKTILLK